uniref:Uncharacterized protein n=1 Tax=Mycena chlorophos TaxID=658473 RepID=A0ABQ0L1J9_MYCCL|nr:predicted protein [Mycena chlorophos]
MELLIYAPNARSGSPSGGPTYQDLVLARLLLRDTTRVESRFPVRVLVVALALAAERGIRGGLGEEGWVVKPQRGGSRKPRPSGVDAEARDDLHLTFFTYSRRLVVSCGDFRSSNESSPSPAASISPDQPPLGYCLSGTASPQYVYHLEHCGSASDLLAQRQLLRLWTSSPPNWVDSRDLGMAEGPRLLSYVWKIPSLLVPSTISTQHLHPHTQETMPATRKRPRPSSPRPGPGPAESHGQKISASKKQKDNGEAVVATDGDARRTRRKSVAGTSGIDIADIEGPFTIIARCPRPARIIHHATASSSRTKADSKREIKLELEEDMNASASTGPRRKSTTSPRMATKAQPRYYQSSHPDSKPLPKKVHRPQYPDDEESPEVAGPNAVTNSHFFASKEPSVGKKSRQVRVSSEVAQSRVQEWRNSTAMIASVLTPESA